MRCQTPYLFLPIFTVSALDHMHRHLLQSKPAKLCICTPPSAQISLLLSFPLRAIHLSSAQYGIYLAICMCFFPSSHCLSFVWNSIHFCFSLHHISGHSRTGHTGHVAGLASKLARLADRLPGKNVPGWNFGWPTPKFLDARHTLLNFRLIFPHLIFLAVYACVHANDASKSTQSYGHKATLPDVGVRVTRHLSAANLASRHCIEVFARSECDPMYRYEKEVFTLQFGFLLERQTGKRGEREKGFFGLLIFLVAIVRGSRQSWRKSNKLHRHSPLTNLHAEELEILGVWG